MATKRAGRTVKVSVSLDAQDVAVLKKLAKESYDGNLSAAFGDAARLIRQREARRRLVEALGGRTLTPNAREAIDGEQVGALRHGPKRPRRRKAAA